MRTPIFGVSWSPPRYRYNIVPEFLAELRQLYGDGYRAEGELMCHQKKRDGLAEGVPCSGASCFFKSTKNGRKTNNVSA